MDSKLTLKLDSKVIERAKKYARQNNISLSRLIENYLQFVASQNEKTPEVTPLVESLTGVITLDSEDIGKDYSDFLAKKYS